jgi:B9 domain-containing protein 1
MATAEEQIVWNFPIDISFNSTNVYGWPRIAISVYGIDFLGRDVIRGYGSALVPLSSGQHQLEIDMFNPMATSYLNEFMSWAMGNPPEVSAFSCEC